MKLIQRDLQMDWMQGFQGINEELPLGFHLEQLGASQWHLLTWAGLEQRGRE